MRALKHWCERHVFADNPAKKEGLGRQKSRRTKTEIQHHRITISGTYSQEDDFWKKIKTMVYQVQIDSMVTKNERADRRTDGRDGQ